MGIINGRRRLQAVKRQQKSFVPWYRAAKDCGKAVGAKSRRLQMVVPEIVRVKACRDIADELNQAVFAGEVTTGQKWANWFKDFAAKVGDDYAVKKVAEVFKDISANRPGITRRLQSIVPTHWTLQVQTNMNAKCINTALFKPKNETDLV